MKIVLAEEHSERNSRGQTWTESRNHHSDSQVTERKSPKVVLVKPEEYSEWNSCRWTWTERRNHRSDCQVTEQRFLDAHPHYWKLVWKAEEALAKVEEPLEQKVR